MACTPPRSTLLPYTTLFRSGPDAPLPDGVDLLRGRVASLRRLLDEGVVGRLHVHEHPLPLVKRERAHRRIEIRVLALGDRKSTRLNSSHMSISYAVFCLKKK